MMKKQYMDFVPATAKAPTINRAAGRVTAAARTTSKPRVTVTTKHVRTVKTSENVGFTSEKKPKLGAVENLNTRFVRSDVPKRPLSRSPHFTTGKTGIAATKARKVGLKELKPVKSVEKPVDKSRNKKIAKTTYQAPKTPFVNQGKVNKRPLSAKNVYPKKKIEVKADEPKGTVTIIDKPEKQAHAGMIITIVLTIILGAAAGTVAFLLLPK